MEVGMKRNMFLIIGIALVIVAGQATQFPIR